MYEFQKGDHVVYKNNGVCLIEDIRPLPFGTTQREYYVLRRLNQEGTVYVPVENTPAAPRPQRIPTKQEIHTCIDQAEHSDLKLPENSKLRITALDKILASGDRASILRIIKILISKKKEAEERSKRLCSNEERILTAAEKLITEEFSFALNLPQQQVIPYILERIKEQGSSDAAIFTTDKGRRN